MYPVLPLEVIALILSELDDDLSALLNCRLVCRSWNAECLKVLRKSKFRKTLTSSDLQKGAQFGCHEGGFILPFELVHDIHREGSQTEEEFEEQCLFEFQTMSKGIVRLKEIFGPDCIREYYLIYDPCTAKGLVALNKFLGLICTHLEKFELCFASSESLSRRETVQILRKAPVLFPNLREFSCITSLGEADDDDDLTNTEGIESVLIENSHNLENVSITTADCGYVYWPKQTPAALQTLKSLHIEKLRHRFQFVQNLRASRPEPDLETFGFSTSFEFNRSNEEIEATAGTLQIFSKTLKSLTAELGPSSENNTDAFPFRFPPCFPQLEHLSLTTKYLHCPAVVDLQDFNISPTTFPVLHSVQIPFGCILVCLPSRPPSAQNLYLPTITFPTVRNLTFLMNKYTLQQDTEVDGSKWITWEGHDCQGVCRPSCDHDLEMSPKKYSEFIAELIPNITKLTVSNTDDFWELPTEGKDVEKVIKAILQSKLGSVIAEFEVVGYDEDYLKTVLETPDFVSRLPILRNIRYKMMPTVKKMRTSV